MNLKKDISKTKIYDETKSHDLTTYRELYLLFNISFLKSSKYRIIININICTGLKLFRIIFLVRNKINKQ